MEECTIKYGDSGKEISENTKKIIALVESEDFLKSRAKWLSDVKTLQKIVYSARADVHYKRELLNGIIEEFQNTDRWNNFFMEYYEPFCMAVDFMESADGVPFTLTKVTRDKNNILHHDDNFPVFSSVDEISRYIASRFDEQKDSEDDPEWYIAKRHENIKESSLEEWEWEKGYKYLISKRGTVWKCGFYGNSDIEDESIGFEIGNGQFIAGYGDIIVFDRRPFFNISHMIYAYDGAEDCGLYVENGKLKIGDIECHFTHFEEFAFELRCVVQEDMTKLSEQEHILLLIKQKYNPFNNSTDKFEGNDMLMAIIDRICKYERETGVYAFGTYGIPVEIIEEEFLK